MTFWQDAPPARAALRMPRRPDPSGGGRGWRRRAVVVVAAVVLATVIISVTRGGDETAKATALPTAHRRSPRKPTVIAPRWKRTLPDWAASMRTDHGDAIVISDSYVTAIALDDGRLRWQTKVPRVNELGVVRGDTVLLSTETGFTALHRTTGAVRWKIETPETPGAVALVGAELEDQIAVVSTEEGGLVGLDRRTGSVIWSVRYSGSIRGLPAVDRASGTVATVWEAGATGTVLRMIDGATGALRWAQQLAAGAGAPIIGRGTVAVSAGTDEGDAEVRAFALSDGAPRWRSPVGAPSQPTEIPLVDGDALVVVDQLGTVTRLALADGTREWATNTKAIAWYAQPIRVRDAILVWNETGEVVTLDRATGAIRARRRPAGLPIGLAATGRVVVVAQRLVRDHALQAFDARRLAGPARNR